jgi:hypothetical protein
VSKRIEELRVYDVYRHFQQYLGYIVAITNVFYCFFFILLVLYWYLYEWHVLIHFVMLVSTAIFRIPMGGRILKAVLHIWTQWSLLTTTDIPQVTGKLDHIMLHEYTASPWEGFELTALVVIGTDCTGSCISNYHMITAKTARDKGTECGYWV